jgi:hypothetical protein
MREGLELVKRRFLGMFVTIVKAEHFTPADDNRICTADVELRAICFSADWMHVRAEAKRQDVGDLTDVLGYEVDGGLVDLRRKDADRHPPRHLVSGISHGRAEAPHAFTGLSIVD